jgi:hypothetical protein
MAPSHVILIFVCIFLSRIATIHFLIWIVDHWVQSSEVPYLSFYLVEVRSPGILAECILDQVHGATISDRCPRMPYRILPSLLLDTCVHGTSEHVVLTTGTSYQWNWTWRVRQAVWKIDRGKEKTYTSVFSWNHARGKKEWSVPYLPCKSNCWPLLQALFRHEVVAAAGVGSGYPRVHQRHKLTEVQTRKSFFFVFRCISV